MGTGVTLDEDLGDGEWLEAVADLGEELGYFSELGRDHAALFVERGRRVIFVCFETLAAARRGESGLPLAFDVCERRDWSHLTLLARRETWFRDDEVVAFFDRIVDDAFFEEFDRVIFYGAGSCGYAAAAYSVTAPGASVIAVAPQATLARPEAAWDDRFPAMRRTDFRSRYGYAPDMIEAAERMLLIADPDETEDAMHASLFAAGNVIRQDYRRGDAPAIDADLRSLGLVSHLAEAAADDGLTAAEAGRILRARRGHIPYLRALLARTLDADRPFLTALLCRAVLQRHELPRFRQHLERAEARLADQGRVLPRPRTAERA